jgi:hypothetical protein
MVPAAEVQQDCCYLHYFLHAVRTVVFTFLCNCFGCLRELLVRSLKYPLELAHSPKTD